MHRHTNGNMLNHAKIKYIRRYLKLKHKIRAISNNKIQIHNYVHHKYPIIESSSV